MKKALSILFFVGILIAQEAKPIEIQKEEVVTELSVIKPLSSPQKAMLYSSVIPGLGQAYNKKYWKIPVVYAALGASAYFFIKKNEEYHDFRDAYKLRIAGQADQYTDILSDERLVQLMDDAEKNKSYSMIAIAVFYVMNIIDAGVDAHLSEFTIDENLSLSPTLQNDAIRGVQRPSLGLKFKF